MKEHLILNRYGSALRDPRPVQILGEDDAVFQRRLGQYNNLQELACTSIRSRVGYNGHAMIDGVNTASEMLEILETFKPSGIGALQDLCKQFYSLSLSEHANITEYTTAVRKIDNELKELGPHARIPETHLVQKYLHGLGPSYNMFHSTFNQTHSEPDKVTLTTVSKAAIAEEKRIQFNENEAPIAMFAKRVPTVIGSQNSNSTQKYCNTCKKPGHWEATCFIKYPHLRRPKPDSKNLKPKPSNKRLRTQTIEGEEEGTSFANMAYTFMASSTPVSSSQQWIFDTGCTQHVCNNRDFFTGLKKLSKPVTMRGVNSVNLLTEGGTVQLTCSAGKKKSTLTLDNVVYFPEAPTNLISINSLRK